MAAPRTLILHESVNAVPGAGLPVIEAAKVENATTLWGMGRNPDRRWWTFWRPRWVMMKRTEIERFTRG